MAAVSRFYIDNPSPEETKEAEAALVNAARHNDWFLDELDFSARATRQAVKDYKLQLPKGLSLGEIPVVRMQGDRIGNAITLFARKLFLALYYKHAGEILSNTGAIYPSWLTNLQAADLKLPVQLLESMAEPSLTRCNTSLTDQFFYQYGVTNDKNAHVFLCQFRLSFMLFGIVVKKPEILPVKLNGVSYSPFTPKDLI